ncbi:MAG: hypothetical protein RMK89_06905 [Armatimonadota bacterium]|nr:hypothetical protein [Armatimonadota bacterium]MDW8143173.1 hypothetical protein [Armatimonadota bacterium]
MLLWAKISDGAVNLEEVQGITINERVEGKFVLVILFKNGQIVAIGDYPDKNIAIAELENFLRRLKERIPSAVL